MPTTLDHENVDDANVFQQIIDRALGAELKADLISIDVGDRVERIILSLQLPTGRSNIDFFISEDDVEEFAAVEFEKYRFVEGYYGVYCPAESWLEVL